MKRFFATIEREQLQCFSRSNNYYNAIPGPVFCSQGCEAVRFVYAYFVIFYYKLNSH